MNDLEATRKVKDAAMDELQKARERIEALEREVAELRAANRRAVSAMRDMEVKLHEIAEEWAGAECGEPVYAQEAYAIGLAKRMYVLATEGLCRSGKSA